MAQEAPGSTPRYLREAARLRARFAGVWHASLVDKDFDHLTSDRRSHLDARTWFLGEVCFTSAFGRPHQPAPLPGAQLETAQAGQRPAVVTRRQPTAGAAVELAPAVHPHLLDGRTGGFVPGPTNGLLPGTCFDLLYRRPVSRDRLGRHFATLTGADKQRLAAVLAQLRTSSAPHRRHD